MKNDLVKLSNILISEGAIEYPENHKPGMKVPKGGAMCGNCEYWKEGNVCGNKYWLQWHDEDENIPHPGDEYCCNWWNPKPIKND